MRVVLNVESLTPPLTGIGNYTLHLLRGLASHREIDEVLCFGDHGWVDAGVLAAAPTRSGPGARATGGWRRRTREFVRSLPGAYELRARVRESRFRRSCRGIGPAVYHEPNFVLKPFDGPCVATIHDLSHLRYPQFHPRERVVYLERHLPATLERADLIVTPSEFVRDELVQTLGVAPDRIEAIALGVDSDHRPREPGETAGVLARHGLAHRRYLLSVATMEPRKNLEGLLDAYSRLAPPLRRAFPLVLAGARGWRSGALAARIEALLARGEIRALGYVPAQELPVLFAGAAAFAFVSFYEGFGLPVLEAMASGVPVLASQRASIPELVGEAALQVDPDDTAAIAQGLRRLLEDEALRTRLAAAGRERSAAFGWDTFVERTVSAYRRVRAQRS